jgi:hypothetical protein
MDCKKLIFYKNILIALFYIIEENLIFDVICLLLVLMEFFEAIGIKMDTYELVAENLICMMFKIYIFT